MPDRVPFARFWALRASGYGVPLKEILTSPFAAVLAYGSARLRLRPDHVTALTCVAGFSAFLAAFVLPVERPVASILAIWALAQAAFLLDCADGLLARATGTESRAGQILDHTLDFITYAFALSAVFVFVYREALAQDQAALGHAALTVGFFFILARSARYHTWQMFGDTSQKEVRLSWSPEEILKTAMEFQVSMLGVLAFLVSPTLALLVFAGQATILALAYFRHIARARSAARRSEPAEAARPKPAVGRR